MLKVRKLVLAVATATAMTSGVANALGLGAISVKSSLNQPLLAEIELLETKGLSANEIKSRLASAEEFARAGVDRQFLSAGLKFTPVVGKGGRHYVRVTSERPIREPYLNFLVEVLWTQGRALKEYTLLLDPPMYTPQQVVYSQPATAPVTRPAPAAAPVRTQAARPAPATPAAPATRAPAARAGISGDNYVVQRNDTLWSIAQRVGGQQSIHQTIMAIQEMNPSAFINGNINKLKAGHKLALPDREKINTYNRGQAVAQVREQIQSGRSAQPAQRQLDARRATKAEAAPKKLEKADTLRLLATESGKTAAGSDKGNQEELNVQLALAKERLDSSQRENQDLYERVEDLNSQVEKLQRLLELKNTQLSNLQNSADDLEAEKPEQAEDVAKAEDADKVTPEAVAEQEVGQELLPDDQPELVVDEATAVEAPVAVEEEPVVEQLKTEAETTETAETADAAVEETIEPVALEEPAAVVEDAATLEPELLEVEGADSHDAALGEPQTLVAEAPEEGADQPLAIEMPVSIEDASEETISEPVMVELEPVVTPEPEPVVEPEPAKEQPAPAPEKAAEPVSKLGFLDGLMENPLFLPGAGAGAAGLLLLLLLAARRRNKQEEGDGEFEAEFTRVNEPLKPDARDIEAEEIFTPDFGNDFDDFTTDGQQDTAYEEAAEFEAPLFNDADNAPTGVIAEADAHIAVGRFSQAADVLLKAIDAEPSREDLRVKLLEVYADLEDKPSFSRQIDELGNMGVPQARIDALLQRYTHLQDDVLASLDEISLDDPVDAVSGMTDNGLSELDALLAGTEEGLKESVEQVADTAGEALADLDDLSIDFDSLELEQPAVETTAEVLSLDDLGFESAAVETSALDELDALSLEMPNDLDLSIPTEPAVEAEVHDELDLDSATAELDALLGGLDMGEAADSDLELESLEGADDLDAMLKELEQHTSADAGPSADPMELSLEDAISGLEQELTDDFSFLGNDDGGSTQLELASAYIGLGDHEGARTVLEEVLGEGSEEQKAKAREMLDGLDA